MRSLRSWHRAVLLLGVGVPASVLMGLRPVLQPLTPGLDASYVWAANQASARREGQKPSIGADAWRIELARSGTSLWDRGE